MFDAFLQTHDYLPFFEKDDYYNKLHQFNLQQYSDIFRYHNRHFLFIYFL